MQASTNVSAKETSSPIILNNTRHENPLDQIGDRSKIEGLLQSGYMSSTYLVKRSMFDFLAKSIIPGHTI